LNPGDVFRIDDPGVPDYPWVVVLCVDQSGAILAAPILQATHKCFDNACTISAHEHPSVWRDSFVNYQLAKFLTPQIQNQLKAAFRPEAPVSAALVERAQKGGLKSLQAYIKHQDILRACGVTL
jgi:hypothetical protein